MTSSRVRQRPARGLMLLAAGVLLAACGSGSRPRPEFRLVTQDFVIRVSAESLPVRALEPVYWRVVVHERETGKPVEGGQGRVFATSRDRKTIWDGFAETGELGTYRARLMYVTSGMWAMAVQFRRDSTQVLQKTEDWTQDVLSADEPGNIVTPVSSPLPNPDSARRADSLRKIDSLAMDSVRKRRSGKPPAKP